MCEDYMLLDVGQASLDTYPASDDNLLKPLLELEKTSNPRHIRSIIERLVFLLKDAQLDRLRKDILRYVLRAMKLQERFPHAEFNSLEEVCVMSLFSQNMDAWDEQVRQRATEEGLKIGLEQGMQQGVLGITQSMLQQKFGSLPLLYVGKLGQMNVDELQILAQNILDAETLEDVFEFELTGQD